MHQLDIKPPIDLHVPRRNLSMENHRNLSYESKQMEKRMIGLHFIYESKY